MSHIAPFSFLSSAISILPPLYGIWSRTKQRRGREMEKEVVSQALTSPLTTLPSRTPLQTHSPHLASDSLGDSAPAVPTAISLPQPGSFPPLKGLSNNAAFQGNFLREGWHLWPLSLKPCPHHTSKPPSWLRYLLPNAYQGGTYCILPIIRIFSILSLSCIRTSALWGQTLCLLCSFLYPQCTDKSQALGGHLDK